MIIPVYHGAYDAKEIAVAATHLTRVAPAEGDTIAYAASYLAEHCHPVIASKIDVFKWQVTGVLGHVYDVTADVDCTCNDAVKRRFATPRSLCAHVWLVRIVETIETQRRWSGKRPRQRRSRPSL